MKPIHQLDHNSSADSGLLSCSYRLCAGAIWFQSVSPEWQGCHQQKDRLNKIGEQAERQQEEQVKSRDAFLGLVLTTRRNCWENLRLKSTRTTNHSSICKQLADKKVSYIQLRDAVDKSSQSKTTFPSLTC